jgi:nucleoside 2-deoxyribosyltransferase
MKVYVASHDRWAACHVADVLERAGHAIVSMWHEKEFNPTSQHTEAERAAIAEEDFGDVARADALVLIAGPDKYSGGKFVEAGIALGQGKPVIVLGRRENMLMWLPQVRIADTPQEAAKALTSLPQKTRAADTLAVWCRRCRSVCEYGCDCSGGNPQWPLVTKAELNA